MTKSRKSQVAIAVAAASLAGAGAAVAESGHAHSNTLANATDGKSASGLVDALVAAAQKHIAADVTSGRLSQTQADEILSGLKQHITARVNSTGPPGGPRGHGGPHGGLDAAATYLGLSESDLMTELQSGKTLGTIADATAGKSKAGLVAALVADEKTHLNQAVKDGRLTQAQADTMAANLESRITDLVNGKLPPRPDGPRTGEGPPPGDGAPPA